jgi:putative ABC transport system ATP-binding protein
MQQTSHQTPLIELCQVDKYYSNGEVFALRQVSLSIAAGQSVSIVGPSGCGKSTLLNMIGALDQPTDGQVLVKGIPTRDWDLNRLRSKEIGFVFQSFYLLPNLTALENVQIPMFESHLSARQRASRAEQLLERVGMQQRQHHLPNQLSNGQRQRVAIARALANQPSLLLADEPTGSLDSANGQEVFNLLLQLNQTQAVTLVVVTHDPDLASRLDRQVRMLDGQIVQDSRPT